MTLFPSIDDEIDALAAGIEARNAKARSLEEDLTPPGVVRAGLDSVLSGPEKAIVVYADTLTGRVLPAVARCNGMRDRLSEPSPTVRVADLCCGPGVWSQQMRALADRQCWPVHITGIEIDAAKRKHAVKWCDKVEIGDVTDYLRRCIAYGVTFDMAMANPAFTLLAPKVAPKRKAEAVSAYEDRLEAAVESSLVALALRVTQVLILFHQTQSFQRGRVGREIWRRFRPAVQWLVPGSIDFRGGTLNPKTGKPWGTDTHDYCVTLWLRDNVAPTEVRMMPELAIADRKWRPFPGAKRGDVRQQPGTETAEQARALGLVMAPGIELAADR